jgi:hypothetical protein
MATPWSVQISPGPQQTPAQQSRSPLAPAAPPAAAVPPLPPLPASPDCPPAPPPRPETLLFEEQAIAESAMQMKPGARSESRRWRMLQGTGFRHRNSLRSTLALALRLPWSSRCKAPTARPEGGEGFGREGTAESGVVPQMLDGRTASLVGMVGPARRVLGFDELYEQIQRRDVPALVATAKDDDVVALPSFGGTLEIARYWKSPRQP